ncbi:hypothetical protein HYH03_001595 [Edaphochlamys debaryana]|uniref:Carbonic anhydrase n=1 Tax=Edaphochlamys debaryana TaxID=47281 RepID=A0A836C674_9CHLO|nr:hypothetical protein HYH03_001595 [Edaphochlamys debaryana]|eukprot:KAG2500833.1 hypothetical protein HYH03_001595 [Edaphochlamys debaryana]
MDSASQDCGTASPEGVSPPSSSSSSGQGLAQQLGGRSVQARDPLAQLLENNRTWSAARLAEDPEFFNRLCGQQSPQFLWIGCSDSRVPANQILGLAPGEVFVQRNVGNQATHTDLNCMSCLEYAVKELKVKNVIVCGHYGCGAVKGALTLPYTAPIHLVNCWISDIRECRNQHRDELMQLSGVAQVDRLCELNVLRQTFHVCTSPVVQAAWEKGQELNIYGLVYSLKDGLIKKLVGPISHSGDFDMDQLLFEEKGGSFVEGTKARRIPAALLAGESVTGSKGSEGDMAYTPRSMDTLTAYVNTMRVNKHIAQHVGWLKNSTGGEEEAH